MRLFLAIEVPGAWREAAWRIGAALDGSTRGEPACHEPAVDQAALGILRRVDRSRMHLTLRFLGEVADDVVPALQRELERHLHSGSLELALGRPGTFGGPSRTSVVWLAVTGDLVALHALAEEIEAAVVSAELSATPHNLRPHLTVARVRRSARPAQRRALATAVEATSPPAPHRFRVERLVLIRSQLGSDGPRYEEIASFRLPASGL